MVWPTQGSFGIKGLGADHSTRHAVLFMILIANAVTLIFALDRVVEKSGYSYGTVSPDILFYGLLVLSVAFSVVSYFLPRYQDMETRFGARAIATGLPIGAVGMLLYKVI